MLDGLSVGGQMARGPKPVLGRWDTWQDRSITLQYKNRHPLATVRWAIVVFRQAVSQGLSNFNPRLRISVPDPGNSNFGFQHGTATRFEWFE
jgi:hypothetical protein